MLEGARKFSFPEGLLDAEHDCVLLCIPVPVVPYVRRFFAQVQSPYIWKTREDFARAYPIFTEIEAQMSGASCVSKIVEANDRIYRLLDTALNGKQYNELSPPRGSPPGTPSTITPEIPVVPEFWTAYNSTNNSLFGLRSRLERLINLVDNLTTGGQNAQDPTMSYEPLPDTQGIRETLREMQGILDAGWFGIGGQPATIANVVEALRIGSGSDNDIIDDALDALSAAATVASIFAVVKDLLSQGVQTGIEGGTLSVLLVSTLANATAQQQMATQLDRIIAALDGGAMLPPDSNVLETLQNINQNVDEVEDLLR